MWFVIKLIIVSFVSTFALFGTFGSDNEWPGLIVAGTAWMLFVWSCMPKGEKERQINEIVRRVDERLRTKFTRPPLLIDCKFIIVIYRSYSARMHMS